MSKDFDNLLPITIAENNNWRERKSGGRVEAVRYYKGTYAEPASRIVILDSQSGGELGGEKVTTSIVKHEVDVGSILDDLYYHEFIHAQSNAGLFIPKMGVGYRFKDGSSAPVVDIYVGTFPKKMGRDGLEINEYVYRSDRGGKLNLSSQNSIALRENRNGRIDYQIYQNVMRNLNFPEDGTLPNKIDISNVEVKYLNEFFVEAVNLKGNFLEEYNEYNPWYPLIGK